MDVEVPLRMMFLLALDDHLVGFDFSILSSGGFAVSPASGLEADVFPHGHASVHGRILSALGTYPEILGEY